VDGFGKEGLIAKKWMLVQKGACCKVDAAGTKGNGAGTGG